MNKLQYPSSCSQSTCYWIILIMSLTNSYVTCLIIDFSKAFDTIDHSVLLSKFCSFGLPANILNWIIDFLANRQQVCKLGSLLSGRVSINRGIIQGSGIGPILYIGMKSDLKAICTDNVLMLTYSSLKGRK